MNRAWATIAVLLLTLILEPTSQAGDIFVRPGESRGDGSREKPFRDPYLAFESADAGDVIHLARGSYSGRLDCGNWTIGAPRLTILGGYSDDFSSRDPWKNRTELHADRDYTGPREEQLLAGQGDHTGLVLDGLLLGGADGNQYGEGPYADLKPGANAGELASFRSPGVVVRNCVFINGAAGAVVLRGEGSRFENNIVVNHVGTFLLKLDAQQKDSQRPMIAKGNTLLFSWSADAVARGGEQGVGITVRSPAQLIDNVIAGCDNHGVNIFARPDQVAVQGNVFWMNGKSNVCAWIEGKATAIDDASMDDLGDLGFKHFDGNVVKDPQLAGLDSGWIDSHSGWVQNHYPKASVEKLAAMRKSVGLSGSLSSAAEPVDVFAAAYPAEKSLLIVPGIGGKGAHPLPLEVKLGPSKWSGIRPSYAAATWEAFAKGDRTLDGKRIELIVPTGNERNFYPFDSIKESDFVGVELLAPTEQAGNDFGERLMAFLPRGSSISRHWTSAANYGRDAREHLYCVRGIAKSVAASSGKQTLTLIVESIAPYDSPPVHKPRPVGRDWFVRAGSSGGDGSKEKPFKDPWQAMEKAEIGDSIHVAAGEYAGKLKSGQWQIEQRYVALLGGYNEAFTARDPWTNRTRFAFRPANEKESPPGTFFSANGNCEGLILDGFIFDGRELNKYGADGSLMIDPNKSGTPLVQLSGRGIAVRNCVFVNSAGPALSMAGGQGTLENNVIVNSNETAVRISLSGDRAAPWIIKHNALLFAFNPRPDAGSGSSSTRGTILSVVGNGPMELQSNIIAFADDYGVYLPAAAEDVKLTGNALAFNLYAHYFDSSQILLDERTWSRRSDDAGFKDCQQNVFDAPKLPVPKDFFEKYLQRSSKLTSKYDHDRWAKFAASVGVTLPQPASTEPTTKPTTSAPSSSGASDLSGLLSGLESTKPKGPAEQPKGDGVYAPAMDLDSAVALASASDAAIGARQVKLDVKFGSAEQSPVVDASAFEVITLARLATDAEKLSDKKITITMQCGRMNIGTNRTWLESLALPADTWTQVIFCPSDPGAPPLGVPVCIKKGTKMEKLVAEASESDSLLIRGTVRTVKDRRGICIVADSIDKPDSP